jgi:hypothetical protein
MKKENYVLKSEGIILKRCNMFNRNTRKQENVAEEL